MAASMESMVEVRVVDKMKGRGLFLLHDVKEGDTILEETPLVCSQFLWNALYKYLACDHCMRALETAQEAARRLSANQELVLPKPDCCEVKKTDHVMCPHCQVQYCSPACRDVAWNQYHQTLCLGQSQNDPEHPMEKLKEMWRNMHYPPETASIMLIARMIATVKQANDKQAAISALTSFCHVAVNEEDEIAHKLLGEQFKDQLDLLRQALAEALFDEDLQQWFTPAGFRSLFALVGTNGQGVGTSSISTWVKNCDDLDLPDEERENLDAFIDQLYVDLDKESGVFLNCEGSALYTLQSACNHSCVPSAEITFPHHNSTLALVALRDIPAGEELNISYLDECARERSRHSRQKILRENYLFNCTCPRCLSEADQPDETSEEDDEEDEVMDQ